MIAECERFLYPAPMDPLTDRAIMLLRREGRLSYNEIARRLGTNRMSIATRLAPLFEQGTLRVIAAVHPRLLGLNVLAHITIRSTGPADALAQRITALPSAVFVSEVTGPAQLVAELHTETLGDLYSAVQRIRASPGVDRVEVLLYEHLLSSFFLGEEPGSRPVPLDDTDLAVVEQLQIDGRTGYAALGERVGLSTSAARGRVSRLLRSGVMQIGVTHGRASAENNYVFGLGIVMEGPLERTVELLRDEPGLELLARAVGKFSLVATVSFTALGEFERLVGRLRALREVRHLEQWMHVRIHIEQYHRGTHRLIGGPESDPRR